MRRLSGGVLHNSRWRGTPIALIKKILNSDEGTLIFLYCIIFRKGKPWTRVSSFSKKNKKILDLDIQILDLVVQIHDLDVQILHLDVQIKIWRIKSRIWTSKSRIWTFRSSIWSSKSLIWTSKSWIWTFKSRIFLPHK